MSVFLVSIMVIKPRKQEEFISLWQKYLKYAKENPEKVKEVKSLKLFTQRFGGLSGAFVSIEEYDSLAEHEKLQAKIMQDKEFMKIYQEFVPLIDSEQAYIWNSAM